jgi:hypothetical protein
LPSVAVCSRRYVVNVALPGRDPSRLNPEAACPTFQRPRPDPFRPRPGEQFAERRIIVPGPKMRDLASATNEGATRSGLTTTAPRSALGGMGPAMSLVPSGQ